MTVEMPPGPPCDGCGEEPAAMSLLSYGDYAQVKVGISCAPNFLRSIADSIDGKQTAERSSDPEGQAPGPQKDADLEPHGENDPPAEGEDEPGSARDHWASTTHVRRSTHGHRAPRGATGKPQPQPEQAGD